MALKKSRALKNRELPPEDSVATPAPEPCSQNGFEWKTRAKFLGLPLVCLAYGADTKGRPRVAKGWIAVGQFALGVVVIAQFGLGFLTLGQVALGVVAGGQLAAGLLTGIGQVGIGTFAVGQLVIGVYGRGQTGWADYLWSPGRTDMEAVAMFETIDWLVQQDMVTIWENIRFEIVMGLKGLAAMFQ